MLNQLPMPERKPTEGVIIQLPEPAVNATNHELRSPAAVWATLLVSAVPDIVIGLVVGVISYQMTSGHTLVSIVATLIYFSLKMYFRGNDLSLILSGDYTAAKQIESNERVQCLSLQLMSEREEEHMKLQWAHFNANSQIGVQSALNQSRETKLLDERDHYKRLAQSSQQRESVDREPVIEDMVKDKFERWLEGAYADHSKGYPNGREPWGNKGEWDTNESSLFVSKMLPKLFWLVEKNSGTGHRTRLNIDKYPSFADAYRELQTEVW